MKRKFTKKKFVIVVLLVFCGYFYLLPTNTMNSQNRPVNLESFEIKSAGYWTNFSYIHITDLNWSTAESYDWVSGDGSWANPYVIENIVIDTKTSPTSSGILIENSSVYFRIENCTIINNTFGAGGSAIRVENSHNGTVIGNNCSNNDAWGGIDVTQFSNNNTISGNIVNDNIYAGIAIMGDDNLVSGNTAINNPGGNLGLLNSNNNSVSGNTVKGASGIYLMNSDINTITGNIISDNVWGVFLDFGGGSSDGNVLYNNQFRNNTVNAWDNGTNNQWNKDVGNYWDDYGGEDLDDDGVGDTPYLVSGTAGSKDYFPIWDDGLEDDNGGTEPSAIPGYPIYLIIGIIGVIFLIKVKIISSKSINSIRALRDEQKVKIS